MAVSRPKLTHVVLHVAGGEAGGREGHSQPVFLVHQDGDAERFLLQVLDRELGPAGPQQDLLGAIGATYRGRIESPQGLGGTTGGWGGRFYRVCRGFGEVL